MEWTLREGRLSGPGYDLIDEDERSMDAEGIIPVSWALIMQ